MTLVSGWASSLLLAMAASFGVAVAKEPTPPAGLDPGGVAVAILGAGVDYTRPTIATRLARDGEGDPVAWDFSDSDIRPFAARGDTEVIEKLLAAVTTIRLVVVKQAAHDPVAVGRMTSFAVQTPARIIFCPHAMSRPDWPILKQAAARFRNHLFVIAGTAKPDQDAAKLGNLAIARANPPGDVHSAVFKLIDAAADLLKKRPELSATDLKAAIAPK